MSFASTVTSCSQKTSPYLTVLVVAALAVACGQGSSKATSVQPYRDCPHPPAGFYGGCLRVPEDPSTPNSRTIPIAYRFAATFDANKDTIVVVNGGPGGRWLEYATMFAPHQAALLRTHNLLFYDQRGTGESAPLAGRDSLNFDGARYLTEAHVEDLQAIVSRVIAKPAIILGHSYGGHLAYAFATAHPESLKKLVILNGGADARAFVVQQKLKSDLILKGLQSVADSDRIDALNERLATGKEIRWKGEMITLERFGWGLLSLMIKAADHSRIGTVVRALIDQNRSSIDEQLAGQGKAPKPWIAQRPIDFDFPSELPLDPVANRTLVCAKMLTEEAIAVADEEFKSIAEQARAALCQGTPAIPKAPAFDVKDQLTSIKVPVLLMGGQLDPLVPLFIQQRDYGLLAQGHAPVHFVTFIHAAHDPASESPACFQAALLEFLEATNEPLAGNRTSTCS